ncbi:MAG: AMP-binding protein [Ferruginibacter sp.]|nr:AMP-binding protein [Ferruginibacter sp.]
MEIDQINRLISNLRDCESNLETYQNGKKVILPFKDMQPGILQVLAFLNTKKICRGDKIGIIGTNTSEWVAIDLACIAAGIITVPLDPALKYEIAEILAEFKLPFILSNVEIYKDYEGVYRFEDVCKNQAVETGTGINPVVYRPEDILTYKFTSGSTQRPKVIGAMKQSVDAAISFVQQLFHHGRQDKIMIFLPLHTYQQRYWIYSAILFDFDIILVAKEYVFHAIKKDQPTVIMGVPFFFETIMKNFLADMDNEYPLTDDLLKNEFHQQLGGRIRYLWTGSAPLGSDTLAFYERMDIPLYQGYGMNEVCIVSKNYLGNNKTGSVGKLLPGKQVKFDHNRQLLVKSEYPVNTSYFGADQEDNKATFLEDGYVATGDLGYIDEDGYLFINGRIKELIVLANAIKVHPAPVEKKMETSPLIKHCIVYGDEHPYLVALVVPESLCVEKGDIKKEISRVNELLRPHERVCNFYIIRQEFNGQGNRLSAQNKILRNDIINEFSDELEKLYTE